MVTIVPKEAYEKLNKKVSEADNSKSGFNMKDFQQDVIHYSMVSDYMKSKDVEFVGEGSGRIAFMLPKGSSDDSKNSAVCLKVAKNIKGIAQNKGEKQMLEKFKGEACVPQLFAYDKKQDIALEMELGRKVSEDEFEEFFGDWNDSIKDVFSNKISEEFEIYIGNDIYRALNSLKKIKRTGNAGKPVIKAVLDDIRKMKDYGKYAPFVSLFEVLFEKDGMYDVSLGDFGEYDNWAFVNRDGVDVLLPIDWGLTAEVTARYYMN